MTSHPEESTLHEFKMFENRVLGGMLERRSRKVIKRLKKRHKEEFHNLYFSLNFIRVIKSRSLS
jgi:hypothetical protein